MVSNNDVGKDLKFLINKSCLKKLFLVSFSRFSPKLSKTFSINELF